MPKHLHDKLNPSNRVLRNEPQIPEGGDHPVGHAGKQPGHLSGQFLLGRLQFLPGLFVSGEASMRNQEIGHMTDGLHCPLPVHPLVTARTSSRWRDFIDCTNSFDCMPTWLPIISIGTPLMNGISIMGWLIRSSPIISRILFGVNAPILNSFIYRSVSRFSSRVSISLNLIT